MPPTKSSKRGARRGKGTGPYIVDPACDVTRGTGRESVVLPGQLPSSLLGYARDGRLSREAGLEVKTIVMGGRGEKGKKMICLSSSFLFVYCRPAASPIGPGCVGKGGDKHGNKTGE